MLHIRKSYKIQEIIDLFFYMSHASYVASVKCHICKLIRLSNITSVKLSQMALVASVKRLRKNKIYKKNRNYFLIQICTPHKKKNVILKKKFFLEFCHYYFSRKLYFHLSEKLDFKHLHIFNKKIPGNKILQHYGFLYVCNANLNFKKISIFFVNFIIA